MRCAIARAAVKLSWTPSWEAAPRFWRPNGSAAAATAWKSIHYTSMLLFDVGNPSPVATQSLRPRSDLRRSDGPGAGSQAQNPGVPMSKDKDQDGNEPKAKVKRLRLPSRDENDSVGYGKPPRAH